MGLIPVSEKMPEEKKNGKTPQQYLLQEILEDGAWWLSMGTAGVRLDQQLNHNKITNGRKIISQDHAYR